MDISMVGGDEVHLPDVLFQPMAADDVASALAMIAEGPAANGTIEIAGPASRSAWMSLWSGDCCR